MATQEKRTLKVQHTVILLRESIAQSYAKDAGSVVACVILCGVGVVLNSGAMQWVGAAMFMVFLVAKIAGEGKKSEKTPQEAADYLAETFDVRAK